MCPYVPAGKYRQTHKPTAAVVRNSLYRRGALTVVTQRRLQHCTHVSLVQFGECGPYHQSGPCTPSMYLRFLTISAPPDMMPIISSVRGAVLFTPVRTGHMLTESCARIDRAHTCMQFEQAGQADQLLCRSECCVAKLSNAAFSHTRSADIPVETCTSRVHSIPTVQGEQILNPVRNLYRPAPDLRERRMSPTNQRQRL